VTGKTLKMKKLALIIEFIADTTIISSDMVYLFIKCKDPLRDGIGGFIGYINHSEGIFYAWRDNYNTIYFLIYDKQRRYSSLVISCSAKEIGEDADDLIKEILNIAISRYMNNKDIFGR
jgi:hypothetical protein